MLLGGILLQFIGASASCPCSNKIVTSLFMYISKLKNTFLAGSYTLRDTWANVFSK